MMYGHTLYRLLIKFCQQLYLYNKLHPMKIRQLGSIMMFEKGPHPSGSSVVALTMNIWQIFLRSGLHLLFVWIGNNSVRGHKEARRRSTGHIMGTVRYSKRQGSKPRRNISRSNLPTISETCRRRDDALGYELQLLVLLSGVFDNKKRQVKYGTT